MNVNDITQDMMGEIRMRFESSPEVRTLRTQQQYAQSRGDFRLALEVAQRIDALFVVVLDEYIKEAESEVQTLDSEAAAIPPSDKDEMMEKIVAMFMCCDIIDTAIRDMNDILHRTKPDCDITTFNDISQLSEMARMKLKYLQENGDYMKDLVWGDRCDNMYEMMCSKARSIMRKRKSDPKWGENMRRLGA